MCLMDFTSTRSAQKMSSAAAITRGIAADGGLFVPTEFPQMSFDKLVELANTDYINRAQEVLKLYLTDYTGDDTVINPKAVRVDSDYIAFPYMLCNNALDTKEIHILLADNSGEVIWDKVVEGEGATIK